MYEDQTFDAIMARLLAAIPPDSGLDTREGSFIYDSLAPAALELAQAYIEMDNALNLGFAQTSSGRYLDYRAGEFGLTRKAAVSATGQVAVTGTPGTPVAAGAIFATGAGVQFQTTGQVILDQTGRAAADVQAVVPGASGNVAAGMINQIPVGIPGVNSVANAGAATGGADQESDTDLSGRFLQHAQHPISSGNIWDYVYWAKQVAGVGDANCIPLWNGNGTVKVVLIDSDKQPASPEIVADASAYIDSEAPIGATVAVVSATGLAVNVAAAVTRAPGYTIAQVQTNFLAKLTAYLQSMAFQTNAISYAQIGALLLNTQGVLDYSGLLVNGGTANIAVANDRVATPGTVTFS